MIQDNMIMKFFYVRNLYQHFNAYVYKRGRGGGPFGKNTWLRTYMYIDIILLDNI